MALKSASQISFTCGSRLRCVLTKAALLPSFSLGCSFAMCRSLPPRRLLLSRPGRHELRVITAVEEDHAVQFLAFHHGPASALRRVHLVVAVPGPLHGWLAIPCGRLAVHV